MSTDEDTSTVQLGSAGLRVTSPPFAVPERRRDHAHATAEEVRHAGERHEPAPALPR